MGYRGLEGRCKGYNDYRAIQVNLVHREHYPADGGDAVVLTVHNDWDTLKYVKENMNSIAANLVRVKQMDAQHKQEIDENAQLFQKNLEPLFTLISATAREHIMDKLSMSLKKALLLMAMERYSCDSDSICRALGISRGKLEKELKRCGLSRESRKAA